MSVSPWSGDFTIFPDRSFPLIEHNSQNVLLDFQVGWPLRPKQVQDLLQAVLFRPWLPEDQVRNPRLLNSHNNNNYNHLVARLARAKQPRTTAPRKRKPVVTLTSHSWLPASRLSHTSSSTTAWCPNPWSTLLISFFLNADVASQCDAANEATTIDQKLQDNLHLKKFLPLTLTSI